MFFLVPLVFLVVNFSPLRTCEILDRPAIAFRPAPRARTPREQCGGCYGGTDRGEAGGNWGIALPPAQKPVATYVPYVITGSLVVVSGQLPMVDGKLGWAGLLGQDVSDEDGAAAARQCLLNVFRACERPPWRAIWTGWRAWCAWAASLPAYPASPATRR